MQLGAINSVNFKANKSSEVDFDKEVQKVQSSEKLLLDNEDVFINGDKKGAAATATAVAYATAKAAAKGAGAAYMVDKITEHRASEGFDKILRQGYNSSKEAAKTLIGNNGKFKKVANFAGKALEGTLDVAGKTFKKVAGGNKFKGLAIASAVASALTFVPMVCLKDDNKDGIKDIAQKSQNVYESGSKKIDAAVEKFGVISKLTQLLT